MPNNEEKIRASINEMDEDIVKDTLAILLSKNSAPISESQNVTQKTDYKNFAQAILDLKRKYKFQELDLFSTEADLVYVNAGDRKILLTDKTVTPPKKSPSSPSDLEPIEQIQEQEEQKDSAEDAFEPIPHSTSRFSHLEL